jgi:hypothetical protein
MLREASLKLLVEDCSGSNEGHIDRAKIVLRARAPFLLMSFSIRVIFFMEGSRSNAGSEWHGAAIRDVKSARNFDRKVRDAVTDVSVTLQKFAGFS